MRVWRDAQHGDVDRHFESIGDLVVVLAGRNVDRLGPETEHQRSSLRRLVGEIQADGCANGFGTTAWLQVHLTDDIGARLARPLVRFPSRPFARGPAQEVAVWKARSRDVHPWESRRRFLGIETPDFT